MRIATALRLNRIPTLFLLPVLLTLFRVRQLKWLRGVRRGLILSFPPCATVLVPVPTLLWGMCLGASLAGGPSLILVLASVRGVCRRVMFTFAALCRGASIMVSMTC